MASRFFYSLRTANLIEDVNGRLAHGTRNVKRWPNSHKCQRWVVAICLHAEEAQAYPQRLATEGLDTQV